MKKFLSLVMALVMVMSLTVIGASAKSFTDDDTITYDEAIDVISTIGVVDGYTDGSFQPNTELNRGQAAKIICNLILGPAAASNLTASKAPFPDVPATHHFAGYISYCAQENIISGYGDGTFRPQQTLSGYAFMKMLLGALGYDQNNEGMTGSNWAIQVAKLVVGVGLDDDLEDDFVGSKNVTRQEACLYALNTLKARTVEYVVPGAQISVNGVDINQKASKATYRTYGALQGGTSSDNEREGNIYDGGYIEFAEEHFSRLVLNNGERDGFGRPEHMWSWKGDKIGSYADTPDATYEAYVTQADLYDDLALTGTSKYFEVFVDGAYPHNFYTLGAGTDYEDKGPDWVDDLTTNVKGDTAGDNDHVLSIDDNSVADSERIGAGPGSVIEVYKTGTQNVPGTIVIVNTYIGEVISVNAAEGKHAANVEIAPVGDDWEDATTTSKMNGGHFLDGDKFGDTFDTDDFEVGDVVTFNYQFKTSGDKASVKKLAKAETVEGEVKDYTDGESFTLGSTEYKYSKMATQMIDSEDISTNIIAYLDKQGNVLYFDEGKDNAKNYALVLDAGSRSAVGGSTFEAELLLADGSTMLVATDELYGASNGAAHKGGDDDCIIGKWVTFRQKSNGKYVLTLPSVEADKTFTNMMKPDHTDAEIATGVNDGTTGWSIGDTSTDSASKVTLKPGEVVRVNSSTIIIVRTKNDTFKVYEGVKNLPEIEDLGGGKILYSAMTRKNSTYAKFLYVDARDTQVKVNSRSNTDIFLVGDDSIKHSSNGNNEYYRFKGVVDGEINTAIKLDWNDSDTQKVINQLLGGKGNEITLSTFSIDDGLYQVALADEIAAAGDGVTGANSVDKVTSTVIEMDGDTYDLADDCKFFRVDANDTNYRITESTWKGIAKGDIGLAKGDRYAYVGISLNRDSEATAIYWRLN